MNQVRFLVAVLLAVSMVACSQLDSSQAEGSPGAGDVIVITTGAAAPAPQVRDVTIRPLAVVDFDSGALVIGTTTAPVSFDACEVGATRQLTITYAITKQQNSPGSFDVHSTWTYQAGTWVGSHATTVNVLPRSASEKDPTIVTVDLTLVSNDDEAAGNSTITVVPFKVVSSPPHMQLEGANATIHVVFVPCEHEPTNQPPELEVPNDIDLEATSSGGAGYDFTVAAQDYEDGDLTDEIICDYEPGHTFPLGESEVTCSVTDSGGLTTTDSFKVTVQDTRPPHFYGVPTEPVQLTAADISGATLDIAGLGIGAADHRDVSPPVTIACMPADLSVLAIGSNTTVECTATDSSAHPSPNTSDPVSFDVTVGFANPAGGLLQPVKADGSSRFQSGRVVPIKFEPPHYSSGPATDLAEGLRFYLVRLDEPTAGPTEYTEYVAGSTVWRYDAKDDQYIFNLSTKGIPSAWYEARVEFQGVLVAKGEFTIR